MAKNQSKAKKTPETAQKPSENGEKQSKLAKKTDPFPNRHLLRVSEIMNFYDVSESTVYLWVQHGHLELEKTPGGSNRITKESLEKCRFKQK